MLWKGKRYLREESQALNPYRGKNWNYPDFYILNTKKSTCLNSSLLITTKIKAQLFGVRVKSQFFRTH